MALQIRKSRRGWLKSGRIRNCEAKVQDPGEESAIAGQPLVKYRLRNKASRAYIELAKEVKRKVYL